MKIRKHIPNALTCAGLAFGFYACILALCGHYGGALTAILLAAGFDFLDGLAARLLTAYSPIGKDLDSLSDMVSFGVAPGMIVFDFIDRMQQMISWANPVYGKLFLVAAFFIPVFSALRLAKFNNDKRQTSSFIGLPVPAHAIFWASLIYVLSVHTAISMYIPPLYELMILSVLAVGSSGLLVSEIPMFSMKVNSLAWKGNELRYVLIAASVLLIVLWGISGIAAIIPLYILLSIFNKQR